MPISDSIQKPSRPRKANPKPIRMPGRLISLGMMRWSMSMKAMATRAALKAKWIGSARVGPTCQNRATSSPPASASTRG